MAIESAPETQQNIGIRFGRPEKTSVNLVVCSLTGNNITVVVDEAPNAIITPTAIGTDQPLERAEAGFAGNAMIGGLVYLQSVPRWKQNKLR